MDKRMNQQTTHILHPQSRLSSNWNNAACGKLVMKRFIAEHDDNATCEQCKKAIEEYERNEV